MVKSEYQNKNGGLNDAGRAFFNHHGHHLKKPNPNPNNPRHKSFCARMSHVSGPMMKDGKPTRKKLALKKWNCHCN